MEKSLQSAEFKRVKDVSFMPKNLGQLKKVLKDTGIWSEVIMGKNGEELKWDNERLLKVFNDYKSGEREFFMSTYRNHAGEEKSRLETGIRTVRGNVYYEPVPGEILNLTQYVTYKVDAIDSRFTNYTFIGKNPEPVVKKGLVTAEILSTRLSKKRDASMSGKVNLKHGPRDPLATLHREMKEEMALEQDDYVIEESSPENESEEMSFGYPGLWTRQKYNEYKIRLVKGFKDEYIDIGHPQAVKGGWKTQINVFRWEKAPAKAK